ncbi:chondroitinase family polysaccharide lyase [Flavobacterium daemonense]|uniref:chondroitinase family polysaccharide lyase n=1 Tax=Flavobacterium daemonense TaxID=1393049 RepID=UPI0011864BD3|nr:chondroitinase family polysaccharide lyase [Flavobacterium daemonense]KAF2330647.1 T9SS type A sorting domain-containing protein [Flavobacterium daemonense]
MKTKLHVVFMLLLFYSFIPHAFATDYYTASANATLAGNSGAVNANWTTNPDGTTGLATVAILATDNLIILNGGTATITATSMTIAALNINAGGTVFHKNNATASAFTINGLLTWNGTIKTIQAVSGSNFFNANGDITGSTAIHDSNSTRGIYLGGANKTINLTQLSTGVISNNSISVGLLLGTSRSLAGNCKFYSPLVFNATTVTLDLAGYNLQASTIKQGNTSTRLIKGNVNSKLTISGTSATLPNTAATVVTFDPAAAVLNELNVNSEYLATAAGPVTVNGNLTVNTLNFGTTSGDKATRTLQVNGNFTLANSGTMRVQAGGPTAITAYDQLNATGTISIGTSTTLKVDFINAYTTSTQPFLTFAQTTSPGTVSGSFGTIQSATGYTGNVTYTGNALKYQLLTTPAPTPPPPACSLTMNPDLPLVASNSTINAEIESILQRFSDNYLGTTEPSATTLNSAIASYNALGITVDGYTISSTTAVTSFDQLSYLKTFAQYLKFHPEDTNNIYTKALNTVWLASDRMCKGLMSPDGNGYSYDDFGKSAILIPRIKDNFYVKSLFENLLNQQNTFDYMWEPNEVNTAVGYDLDDLGNILPVTLGYVKWIDSADERYRYMTAFKRQMDKFLSYSPGTLDGIKPDGSGFHHWASYPSYTGYDLNSGADIIYYLQQTSFQVNTESYLRLRDAIMTQLMFGNDKTTRSIAMGGRKPQELNSTISKFSFRNMAVGGGSIMGTGASDPVMATYYNRVWGGYGPFGNSTAASFNEGYFQFNHSMAGIYRKDNWVATCKGFSDNMFGTEIFGPSSGTANRFGRYQSYGAVDIVYAGDNLTENGYDVTTRDWNFVPGTTVIRLPWDKLHAEKDRVDELQQKRFVGSLSFINKNGAYLKANQGTYGLFAMDFQEKTGLGFGTVYGPESHNNTFTFKKSVFTFDNMLICLGSGIGNNDTTNTTLTTLYQRKAIAGKEVVNVDSNVLSTGSYANSYDGTANHWIIDNFNTGFYVFAGSGTIKLTKADQQTPQHDQLWSAQNISNNPIGNYAIGYIDHGTAPSNKGYEYVCMPKATAADMSALGSQIDTGNKPYMVHRKDEVAHIVEYKPTATSNSIFGYAFFSALSGINNTGQLTGADYPCLVMSQYDSAQKSLKLAINNPDIGFTYRANTPSVEKQINIKIKGTNWQISQPNTRASITGSANGETTIQFTVVDGLPVEITLNRVLTPQTIGFEVIPAKIATDAAFDLTATASSGLPVSYTSSNPEVATISGNTVTIVGKGTSTITAKQDGDDIYSIAEAVEQTLTVNPATQTITFDAMPTKAIGDTNFDLTAAASSNLPVSFTSSNIDVATISGSTVTIVGKGSTTIKASQEGNNIYDAATSIEQILRVNTEPTVFITSPLANANYNALGNITITTDATDVDGSVSKVEFFEGINKLGEATTAPFSFDWNNVALGSYILTAKATDNDGAATTSTAVTVNVICPSVQLSIPDVYAMNPAVDDANTIYIGYGPTSLTLNAMVQGNQDCTYSWNTGAQTPSISVSEAGTYTVVATYAGGCQTTSSIAVDTLDVRCGNKNDKVQICHNNNVICLAPSAVQAHLNHGDKLGSCTSLSRKATSNETLDLGKFTIYPNPVHDSFNVSISSMLDPTATISIYNIIGNKLRQVNFTSMPQNVFCSDLSSGSYILVIQNGIETIRGTIVKQ